MIVVDDFPNQVVVTHAPAATTWAEFTNFPTGLPTNHRGVKFMIKTLNAAKTGDGSMCYYSSGQTTAPASGDGEEVGFPVSSSGQTLVLPLPDKLFLKLGASTDRAQILFLW